MFAPGRELQNLEGSMGVSLFTTKCVQRVQGQRCVLEVKPFYCLKRLASQQDQVIMTGANREQLAMEPPLTCGHPATASISTYGYDPSNDQPTVFRYNTLLTRPTCCAQLVAAELQPT